MTAFLARHPAVSAELLLLDRPVNVVEEGLDVGVRIGALADSSLVAIPVGSLRRVVCASPQYLRKHGVPQMPEDLRQRPCVRFMGLTLGNDWRFRIGRRTVAIAVATRRDQSGRCRASPRASRVSDPPCSSPIRSLPPSRNASSATLLPQFELPPVPVNVIYPHAKLRSINVRTFVDLAVSDIARRRVSS